MIEILQADRSRIWNSIELFKEYQDNHGCALTRCRLVKELRRNIGGDLVVLTNPGYASIIAFHKNAALMLKLVKADDESDDIGRSVSILANHVVKESSQSPVTSLYTKCTSIWTLLLSAHLVHC